MVDRPILFSGPMVRAQLEDRKTNTRRVLKPQPVPFMTCDNRPCAVGLLQIEGHAEPHITLGRVVTERRVRWAVGDRLWVREAWRCNGWASDVATIFYQASERDGYTAMCEQYPVLDRRPLRVTGTWRPSIHMPRWASRLTLIVTGLKIEHLQDISEADALAEGIALAFTEDECRTTVGLIGSKPEDHGWTNYLWHGHVGRGITHAQADSWPYQFSTYKDPRRSFASLWARINGAASWDENPFVVAISSRVVKANIDTLPAGVAA